VYLFNYTFFFLIIINEHTKHRTTHSIYFLILSTMNNMIKIVYYNQYLLFLYAFQGSFDESADETFNKKGPLRSFWSNENNVDVRKYIHINQ